MATEPNIPSTWRWNCFLVHLTLLFFHVQNVSSLHSMFCFNFPSESIPNEFGRQSVGMEKFPPQAFKKYHYNPPRFMGHTQIKLVLSVHNIQGRVFGSQEPLTGWYHVSLKIEIGHRIDVFVRSFVLYATDDQMNPIGEFVYDFPTLHEGDCPDNDATRHMLIPCSGVSKNEPKPSNAIVFVRNDSKDTNNIWPTAYKNHWPIGPSLEEHHSQLHFYFRHSIQDANMNYRRHIVFRVIGDPDPNGPYAKQHITNIPKDIDTYLISGTAWITMAPNVVPGAADPLPTHIEALQCNDKFDANLAGNHLNDYKGLHWLWYMEKFSDDFELDLRSYQSDKHFANSIYENTGCAGNFFGGRCKETWCDVIHNPNKQSSPSFIRIPEWNSKKFSTCECLGANFECTKHVHEDPKRFNGVQTEFHECLEHLSKMMMASPCQMTKQAVDNCTVKTIRDEKRNNLGARTLIVADAPAISEDAKKERVDTSGVRVYGYGTVLYAVRKGHAVIMVIATFLFFPVAIFVSRYYKETFMDTRILTSRVWFQIHIQLVLWIFAFYVGGIIIALSGKAMLGVSLTGWSRAHRWFGWICVVLFIILAAFGGIRILDDPGRKISIGTHWLLGNLLNILNLVTFIVSVRIPGSPAADFDESLVGDRYEEQANHITIGVVVWIIKEIVIHVIMTLSIHSYDRMMEIKERPRRYIPGFCGVPIPVLRENSYTDATGSGFRILMFWLYIGISLLFTIGISVLIVNRAPRVIIGFGPMTCTHEWSIELSRYTLRKNIDPACRYN